MGEPKGYMIVKVEEATGKNKRGDYMWDSHDFEGFVKVEIRGGPQKVKVASTPATTEGSNIYWNQELIVEVLEGANELRLILCRKTPPGTSSTSVISACGIYMKDILDAVPIDKYFELFKPGQGGEGGQIRVSMTYSAGPKKPMPSAARSVSGNAGSQDVSDLARQHAQALEDEDDDEEEGPPMNLIIGGAVAGVGLLAGILIKALKK